MKLFHGLNMISTIASAIKNSAEKDIQKNNSQENTVIQNDTPKENSCPNCGAMLVPNQAKCEYCGTIFKSTKAINNNQTQYSDISDSYSDYSEKVNRLRTTTNISSGVFLIFFGLVWLSIIGFGMGMSIRAGDGAPIFMFIPFIVVGVAVLTGGIVSIVKSCRNRKK